ncbi:MAG: ACP phosphodiesterase [Prolixibacteraceae bacterium]
MNYLAHLYLSGESDEIKLGNFIGDYVKGNKYLDYPEQVAFGIRMHRRIDAFTDGHTDVKECNKLLKPGFGRYSGIVSDIFFDHFLAAKFHEYSAYSLRQFSKQAHSIFISNFGILPFRVKQFLPFLIHHKRLESYAVRDTMFHVLEIMSRRTSLPSNSQWAFDVLNQEYDQFEALFRSFFEEMICFVESEFEVGISKPPTQLVLS